MGNTLEHVKKQLNEFYSGLEKKQKIKIGISGLVILLSMVLLIHFTTRPEYIPLFSQLAPKDVGEITTKLDEMGIPWENNESGSEILVPKEYKNKAKANLAVAGLPKEKFSYQEMIDSGSLTMTNEERKKRYIIAQMNALASTIEEIDGIEKANVNLSVAEESNFLLKDQQSKASVFVQLKKGIDLSKKQVNGITMLVANAVKGLDPENISVVDNKGQILNQDSEENLFEASTQLNLQNQVQNQLQQSIHKFLSTVYGQGNVAVVVNVKLDFDGEVTNIKKFAPPVEDENTGLIRSMDEQTEKVTGGMEGGVPGTDTNTDDITEYVENEANGSQYDKAQRTINYELNEVNQKLTKAQGQVKDITVAVVIDKKALPDGELTDEEYKKVVDLVSASAGVDTKVVEVMTKEFGQGDVQNFNSSDQTKEGALAGIPLWSLGVLGTLLIGGVAYSVYRVRRRKEEMNKMLDSVEEPVQEDMDEIELELDEKSSYKKKIDKFVTQNPEAVAQLLKTWINED